MTTSTTTPPVTLCAPSIINYDSYACSHLCGPDNIGSARCGYSTTVDSEAPGCEDFSFLDQAKEDFEHGLDSILTISINKPKLDASLDDADAAPSSVSLGFHHTVITVSDTSRLHLCPRINSHKLWCQVPG